MTKTATIQISNTDDRLTQVAWAAYIRAISAAIDGVEVEQRFFGGSPQWHDWQRVAWIVAGEVAELRALQAHLVNIRKLYQQESIAWTEGDSLNL